MHKLSAGKRPTQCLHRLSCWYCTAALATKKSQKGPRNLEYYRLLRARNRHSPPPKKALSPLFPLLRPTCAPSKARSQKCTFSCTIPTSILNKITPAVPVWLMGRVWEQRRKDKPPATPPAFHCCASYIGEKQPPGELSQTRSPQEHSGAATVATYAYVGTSDAKAN